MIAARRPASPYARRLARERGLGLTSMPGTGPGGRIVAADVERFARTPAAGAPLPSPALAGAAVAAFATVIDLQKLHALLAEFSAAQLSVTLDVMLLRAGARALAAISLRPDDEADASAPTIAWETGGRADRREIVLHDADKGLVSGLGARLKQSIEMDSARGNASAAGLSVRRIDHAGIRPTAMPLLPGYLMRLVVSAAAADGPANCLLCFDAEAVGEDSAAAFLAQFRDDLETPLRLLA